MAVSKQFSEALKAFEASQKSNQNAARLCSILAIEHFEESGDLVYAQAFLDAMDRNYHRRDAFVAWLCKFSPVLLLPGDKLKKDKSETAVSFNVEAAKKVPYWEFKKAADLIPYDALDCLNAVKSTVKRFSGERYVPLNEGAMRMVEELQRTIANMASHMLTNTGASDNKAPDTAMAAAQVAGILLADEDLRLSRTTEAAKTVPTKA